MGGFGTSTNTINIIISHHSTTRMASASSAAAHARRVAVVTGGSAGLGLRAAEQLLRKGWHVVLACRSPEKAEAAVAGLRATALSAGADGFVEWLPLDLLRLASVRAFAERFLATGLPLHALVLNAGAVVHTRALTEDNLETTFQGNHLGHFLLTHLLLQKLRDSKPARIVVVSSSLHAGMSQGGGPASDGQPSFEWDNIQGEKSYDGMKFYCKSKLINLWFAYALAAQLHPSEITVNAMCPGFVPTTSLKRESHWVLRGLMHYIMPWMSFTVSEEQSSKFYLKLITDPALDGQTGKYFRKGDLVKSSPESYDREQMIRMWNMSVDLAGAGEKLTEIKDIWN